MYGDKHSQIKITYLLLYTERITCLIRAQDFVAILSKYGQLEIESMFYVALGWKKFAHPCFGAL